MTNWIGIYDNALTSEECKFIIDEFEKNPEKGPGMIIGADGVDKIDKSVKDSTDSIIPFNEGTDLATLIGKNLFGGIQNYRKDYPSVDLVSSWVLFPFFNIQKYLPGQGFHLPHCETDNKNSPRILAWMFYLNTLTDGGETRFPGYDLDVKPVEGRLVIWPAYFTHIHHGIPSPTQTKYIATGWHVFK